MGDGARPRQLWRVRDAHGLPPVGAADQAGRDDAPRPRGDGLQSRRPTAQALPDQDEESIIETIEFNRILNPDNVTVAYYSPYLGTERQLRGKELGDFEEYEFDVDSSLRSTTKNKNVSSECLNYYKENFSKLSSNNIPIIKYSQL